MENFISTILFGIGTGLVSGLVASFVFWYSLTHWLVPKIQISPKISKLPAKTYRSGYFYQFKIKNPSEGRPAIDLKFQASIYYPDFPRKGVTNVYPIPLDAVNLMELLPVIKGERRTRRVRFKIDDHKFCEIHQRRFFPKEIKDCAKQESLRLEQLLKISESAFIRVYIAASDEFSGSRKIFKKEYKLEDIVESRDYGI